MAMSVHQSARSVYPEAGSPADDECTKTELVAAGVGVAVVERSEAEPALPAGRLAIWHTEPLYCALHFACAATRQDEPLIHALRRVVAQIWGTPEVMAGQHIRSYERDGRDPASRSQVFGVNSR